MKQEQFKKVKKTECFRMVVNNVKLANSKELSSTSALHHCCSSDTVPTMTFLFWVQAQLNGVC